MNPSNYIAWTCPECGRRNGCEHLLPVGAKLAHAAQSMDEPARSTALRWVDHWRGIPREAFERLASKL